MTLAGRPWHHPRMGGAVKEIVTETYVNDSPWVWVFFISMVAIAVYAFGTQLLNHFFGWGRTPVRRISRTAGRSTAAGTSVEEAALMSAFAARVGWTHTAPRGPLPRPDRTPAAFEVLMEVTRAIRSIDSDVLRGQRYGHDVIVYREVLAETNSTREDEAPYQSMVVAVRMPASLPLLTIGLRGIEEDRGVTGAIGEIEFENEDFNRSFAVMCSDPRLAYDVVSPRAMERLMLFPMHVGTDHDFLVGRFPGGFNVGVLESCMDTLIAVLDAVPDFVWEAQTQRHPNRRQSPYA